ncbi:carboxylesterase/lipase family protein [Geodermatophilus sabuli]|uniref:Carboxylic ester hydrolase n=1 Tax=Geodermatophilus sabuli TaxID=1564158 RepID=A0A285EB25_9ACTN|nr:carboxylesterase/lipase family protein [Geodermatophilus sabuli]MBB3084423.1 para-nitrobenzyl esterase [Geodermatophilus sabuli]SNX96309.1 para-nitrobenzyl esterase [Geodermatophilus sabuli]
MDTIVGVRSGRVRGRTVGGVSTFLGIPYAAPPSGERRLRPPQPVEPWDGVRDATVLGPEPPQPDFGSHDPTGFVYDPALPGDDCLNLNVWTPDAGAGGMPVMVWIPGGAFQYSSGGSYDGSRFARDGVVCVTINYRTGADGFLYLGEGDDGADLGLLDQVAALTWVRDGIAAFGGDPDRVTVFGESAGAMSIGTLLSMPRAEGLFRRAVLQSGAAHHVVPAAEAARIGRRLAEVLGVPATRDAVGQVPVDRLLAAQGQLDAEVTSNPDPARWGREVATSTMPFHPVVDGDVVPAAPMDRIAAGAGRDVDVLIGTNSDDWRMFPVFSGLIDRVTDEVLSGSVEAYGLQCLAAYGLPVETALRAYRGAHPDAGPGDLLAAVQTDWWVRIPAVRLADAHAPCPGATFMYEFAWPSPAFGGRLGACHALELPFVFDTLDRGTEQMMGGALGSDPPQQLADTVHGAWVAFATCGDPGWPRYGPDRRATMRLDIRPSVVEDPYARERALWAGVR